MKKLILVGLLATTAHADVAIRYTSKTGVMLENIGYKTAGCEAHYGNRSGVWKFQVTGSSTYYLDRYNGYGILKSWSCEK